MNTLLLLVVLAAPPADGTYQAWVDRDDIAHIRYAPAEFSPRRLYVHPSAQPTCSVCPPGPEATIVLDGSQIYQEWPNHGKWVEAQFPVSAVGGMRAFYFSLTGDASPPPGEHYINGGEVPRGVTP